MKGKGIDLDHKRFLILQGEVESIALMKPKGTNEHEEGLLEYLEDIIGTSKYVSEIKEAENLFEKCSSEYAEQLNRFKILEKELNSLKGKKDEAEVFIQKEKELNEMKGLFYQQSIFEMMKEKEGVEGRILDLEAKIEKLGAGRIGEEMKKVESDIAKEVQNFEELKAKVSEAMKEMGKFEREEIALTEKEKHMKKKLKTLAKSIEEKSSKIRDRHRNNEINDNEIVSKKKELESLESNLIAAEKEYEKIMEALKGKTSVYQDEIDVKLKKLQPTQEKVLQLKSELEVIQCKIDLLESKFKEDQQGQVDVMKRMETLEQSIRTETESLASNKADRSELMKVKEMKEKELRDVKKAEAELRGIIEKNTALIEEEKSRIQSDKIEGNLMTCLMKESSAGRINGIYGRLGDLGTIDSKYETAITTACGSLDHIVVETTVCAQKCVEFLKRNNLGRSTFIILEKLSPEKKFEMPSKNCVRLIDVIEFKEDKFRAAFYYAVRDTLIADSLDEANKIAFGGSQRHRVVTIDGKLIDKSGTMSGGGSAGRKGFGKGMKVTVKTEIEKLEKETKKRVSEYSQIQQALEEIQKDLTEINGHLNQLELLIRKSEMNLQSFTKQAQEQQQSKPSRCTSEDQTSLTKLQKEAQKKVKEIESIQDTKLEAEIRQLQEQILSVGGIKLKSQKSKVDGLREQIEVCKKRISKLQVENSVKEIPSADLSDLEKELAQGEEELKKLEQEISMKTKIFKKMEMKCEESKRVS